MQNSVILRFLMFGVNKTQVQDIFRFPMFGINKTRAHVFMIRIKNRKA